MDGLIVDLDYLRECELNGEILVDTLADAYAAQLSYSEEYDAAQVHQAERTAEIEARIAEIRTELLEADDTAA